jgi:HSP20 family molecular chaperone IbpA
MWAEAFDLLERAERLHRQFFRFGDSAGAAAPRWEPPADVIETHDRLIVTVALPGVRADRIEVQAADGVLHVVALRPAPIGADTRAIRHLEIPYGRFERRIALPPGLYELISNEFTDGCLYIALARRGERT